MLVAATLWPASLKAQDTIIASVDARFDIEQAESYVSSVANYLSRFLGKEASEKNSIAAEDFLKSLYFVSTAQCNFLNVVNLVCYIKSKRIIRAIKISGLPASLLEEELKRKLPIQVGHTIDLDEKFQEVLSMVKSRVDIFLKKNGFFGAVVLVQKNAPSDSTWLDIDVKIEGGVFVRVNEVMIYGDPPITVRAVKKLYQRMCFSFNRIVESISLGTLNCYSRELELDTTQSLRERFAKMGYVQSRIYISHHWVDPHDSRAPPICQSKNVDDKTERCINLRIDIDKGPKVTWTVNIKDRLWISRNKFLRFIGSMFSVDQFSRASVSTESDEVALDHLIIKEELEGKITFVSAKNIDEQELNDSAKEIANYLVSQGYVNAEVTPSLNQDDPANINVNFDVYAGSPYFVDSVQILPEMYREFVTDEDLALLLNVRSVANNGHLSYQEIESARKELETRFNERGFINIKVNADLESVENGKVNVTFYVTSEGRKIVDEIIILNGFADINESILPTLKNCDNYIRPRRHDRQRKLCRGSSLVSHAIEGDSNRIVDFYQTNAFLYARVKSEVVTNDAGNQIIFTLYDSRFGEDSLVPLKKQEIKDIIVSGNSSTRISVIKRLFPTKRRSVVLDPIALKKGLANLRESGRFSRIDQKILAGQEDSDDVYFVVQLTERPSLTLDTSIAFSTDQLFSFETELEEANLFSSMLKLNTTLGLGLFWGRQTIFNNKLIWPLILGKPLRLTLNAPMIVYDDFTHRPGDKAFRRLQSKVSVGFEWKATQYLMPYIRYWLILNQKQSFPGGIVAPSFNERISSLDGLIPTIKQPASIRGVLKPGLSYIELDNPFDPRLGVDMNLWTEFSGGPILGVVPFINMGTQNRFFFPIGPFTLAFQVTFMRAFIEPNDDNWEELRDHSSMDSLGGDRSIRGYADGNIGIFEDKSMNHSPYSGYFSNIANMELRFPITTKGSFGNFSGAFFVDQGSLVPCSSFFTCMEGKSMNSIVALRGLGLSVGAALRYSLPVGPISLDYGISPLTLDNRIHILFGYAF